ncbi:MAG: hypothetical protein U9N14_03340 [Pseudomonadota bacterium]|nr:hypothetical protein [Pseudomonadota bacterium]
MIAITAADAAIWAWTRCRTAPFSSADASRALNRSRTGIREGLMRLVDLGLLDTVLVPIGHGRRRLFELRCGSAETMVKTPEPPLRPGARRLAPSGPTSRRRCLCCGRMFDSTWIGNRICLSCSNDDGFEGLSSL